MFSKKGNKGAKGEPGAAEDTRHMGSYKYSAQKLKDKGVRATCTLHYQTLSAEAFPSHRHPPTHPRSIASR